MTIHLPKDLEGSVRAEVLLRKFSTSASRQPSLPAGSGATSTAPANPSVLPTR
jgi:hypothetical protein